MATLEVDMRGMVIGLDHEETNTLLGILGTVSGSGGAATVAAWLGKLPIAAAIGTPVVGWIAAAVAAHVAWESAAIRASDKGHGVWLLVGGPILVGMPGVVIPNTRTQAGVFDGHASDGSMTSERSDTIIWHIDRGVGADNDCKFVLVNSAPSGWAKAFKLYINTDVYWIRAEGHTSAENGTWFHDLPNTQIVFHKPQWLGEWGPAGLTISDFSGLNAKDVTTFNWVKDT